LVGLIAVFIVPAGTKAATLRKGPYLLYRGNNAEMVVRWQTNETPSSGATLEWGSTTAYSNGSVSVSENSSETNQHLHEYTIGSLTPGQRIYYRVTIDGNTTTSSFLAAPASGASSVTFYAFGDTRSYPNRQDRVCAALMDDVAQNPDVRQTISLHTGDWTDDGSEVDWDNEYFNRDYSNSLHFMASLAVQGCAGNHDDSSLLKYWPYAYVDSPAMYYSFDYGPVHIVVLDQYSGFTSGSTQYGWMVADLQNTNKPWKFVVLHEPGYSAAGVHGNDGATQSELVPVFETEGVDVVLAGHNHYYAHAVVNGIQHITAGNGGMYPSVPDPNEPFVVAAADENGFVRFDINGNEMTMIAYNTDGEVLDSVNVVKSEIPAGEDGGISQDGGVSDDGGVAEDGSVGEDAEPAGDPEQDSPEARCREAYGAVADFVFCQATTTSCSFNARKESVQSCGDICEAFGGECLGGHGNDSSALCVAIEDVACDVSDHVDDICVCSLEVTSNSKEDAGHYEDDAYDDSDDSEPKMVIASCNCGTRSGAALTVLLLPLFWVVRRKYF
jgi:predicted phosphodiesterase